ncbi:MAG: amino acid permease [Myxococcales bacterium]|nr:amino acid permease [Myxococcales bacterium]
MSAPTRESPGSSPAGGDAPAGGLRVALGLFQTTMAGVGIILGAGIYVLVGVAAGEAGNALWIAFILAAVVALLTGLSYAELASLYPVDAAEVTYVERSFGRRVAFFVAYLAILAQVLTAAVVAMGFAGYLARLLGSEETAAIALVACAFFTLINFIGISLAAWLNVAFTLLEAGGLVVIIAIGAPELGRVDLLELQGGLQGLAHTAALVFFAYVGFEGIVKLSEETADAARTIPRAIILSIIISTALYVAVGATAVSAMDWRALAASSAPLADVAAAALGSGAFALLAIIALFSTANTILLCLVAGSRTLYGMADRAPWLRIFGRVHRRTQTPTWAIVAIGLMTAPFVLVRDLALIVEYGNFGIFVLYMLVNAALVDLRFRLPEAPRRFRVPGSVGRVPVLPVLGILTCLALLLSLRLEVLIGGALYTLVGAIIALAATRTAPSSTTPAGPS